MSDFVFAPLVAFRGVRTYVHSTTLYEQFLRGAESLGIPVIGQIDFRVSRLIGAQPRFRYVEGLQDMTTASQAASISFFSGTAIWTCLISESQELVVCSEPYDEMTIRRGAVRDGDTIRMTTYVDARPFEIVTSMTLQLHQALFVVPADRRWVLARIRLDRPLLDDDAPVLQVSLIKRTGLRLTRCAIAAGQTPVGSLDFMLRAA